MTCTTHHICDCQKERMKKLEKVVEAAKEYWRYCKAVGWEYSDDTHPLPEAIASLEELES